jgi:hypothetical protein
MGHKNTDCTDRDETTTSGPDHRLRPDGQPRPDPAPIAMIAYRADGNFAALRQ